jgi:hypothetical protein
MQNERLSKKLQLEKDVTLEKAITVFRQEEEIAAQQSAVRALPTAPPLASLEPITQGDQTLSRALSSKPKPKTQPKHQSISAQQTSHGVRQKEGATKQKCMRCGRMPDTLELFVQQPTLSVESVRR